MLHHHRVAMHDALGRILRHLQAELRGALVRAIQGLDWQGCWLGGCRVANVEGLTAGRPERYRPSAKAKELHRGAADAKGGALKAVAGFGPVW